MKREGMFAMKTEEIGGKYEGRVMETGCKIVRYKESQVFQTSK